MEEADRDVERLRALPMRPYGPALKLAFEELWVVAGRQPAHIVIQPRWLSDRLGASDRTARGWLDNLAELGLIHIAERDKRRGTVSLYVYRPARRTGKKPNSWTTESAEHEARPIQQGGDTMLVFTRKRNEEIVISDNIKITVVAIRGDVVRIGIEAPRGVPVHRREVYDAIRRGKE